MLVLASPQRGAVHELRDGSSIAAASPDDRTALLAYVTGYGAEPTTLFVLTRAGPAAHVLPPADTLREQAARFLAVFEAELVVLAAATGDRDGGADGASS